MKSGDKIGIVATGRKVSLNNIEPSRKIFASWGMDVIMSPNLHSNEHSYLAGSDFGKDL